MSTTAREVFADKTECEHEDAFADWFNSVIGPEYAENYIGQMNVLRSAFFSGASYGMEVSKNLVRDMRNESTRAKQ